MEKLNLIFFSTYQKDFWPPLANPRRYSILASPKVVVFLRWKDNTSYFSFSRGKYFDN